MYGIITMYNYNYLTFGEIKCKITEKALIIDLIKEARQRVMQKAAEKRHLRMSLLRI